MEDFHYVIKSQLLFSPGGIMKDNRIIQEAIRTRGIIYDFINALVLEHGIGMVLSILEDICFIQATSMKIHKKDIRTAELWDKIGKQITNIKID